MNEVISDEALLRRYKKEIDTLKQQLDDMKKSEGREIPVNRGRSEEERRVLEEKFEELRHVILNSRQGEAAPKKSGKAMRRQTWFPGVNAHLTFLEEDEEEEEERSASVERVQTSTPGPNPTRTRDSDLGTSVGKASNAFQAEILRAQMSKVGLLVGDLM